ncbi:MAG: hypothetical protein HYU66_20295 [Armatimonadetes bacterium]|nr:hypothetical protein [Armatimonadota bacterium]
MLVAMVLSLTAMVAERRASAAAWLAAAVLVKPAPLVLLPFYLYRWRGRDLTMFAACLLAGYAPLAGAGLKVFAGLGRFAHEWTFNAGLFRWARDLFDLAGAEAPGALARQVMLAVLAVALAQLIRRDHGRPAELPRHAQSALLALLLTSPVANAWYVAWLCPLTVVRTDPAVLAWMVTSVVGYVWYFPSASAGWMRVLEYLPVFALLIGEAWRRSRRRSSPA